MTAARPFKPRPTRAELQRLYIEGRYSIRETAELLGVSKDIINQALREYGIPRRPRNARRSQLADIPLHLLQSNIEAEGMRAHARRLGIDPATLREHVQKRRERGGAK